MASIWYDNAIKTLMTGSPSVLDLDTDTIKIMLCNANYVASKSHQFVSSATAGSGEITATNYTGGYGGAGRKTLATKTVTITSNKTIFDADNATWTALGGAANDTVTQSPIIKEITDDTASLLIINLTFTGVTTNGGDFTVQFDATNGIGYANNA